jgi:hypothetical protein
VRVLGIDLAWGEAGGYSAEVEFDTFIERLTADYAKYTFEFAADEAQIPAERIEELPVAIAPCRFWRNPLLVWDDRIDRDARKRRTEGLAESPRRAAYQKSTKT